MCGSAGTVADKIRQTVSQNKLLRKAYDSAASENRNARGANSSGKKITISAAKQYPENSCCLFRPATLVFCAAAV